VEWVGAGGRDVGPMARGPHAHGRVARVDVRAHTEPAETDCAEVHMLENTPSVPEPQSSSLAPRGYGLKRRSFCVGYNDAEWQQLVETARLCGKPTRVFIRDISLGCRPPEPLVANAELIRELGRSGTALKQLAASARASGALPEATSLEAALTELCDVVRQIVRILDGRTRG
jgi:mobilization protein NikA